MRQEFAGKVTEVDMSAIDADYATWAESIDRRCAGAKGGQILAPFYMRFMQTALKLAMICDLAESGKPTITRDNWERSRELGEFLAAYVVQLVGEDLAFTPCQRDRRDLVQQVRIKKKGLDNILNSLEDEGMIRIDTRQSDGRGRPRSSSTGDLDDSVQYMLRAIRTYFTKLGFPCVSCKLCAKTPARDAKVRSIQTITAGAAVAVREPPTSRKHLERLTSMQ